MATALPLIGTSGDVRLHHTIAGTPAVIYVESANLTAASGLATPASGTLNHNPNTSADASLFAAQTTLAGNGLQELLSVFTATGSPLQFQSLPSANASCIGATTGGVRITKDQDLVTTTVDQIRGDVDSDASSNRWAVETTMAEVTLWNLTLAWGRTVAAVGSSSVLLLKAADQEFHSIRVVTRAPQMNADNSVGTYKRGLRIFQFFKSKAFMSGALELGRDNQQSIPISFTCFPDGNENWGVVCDSYNPTTEVITIPAYNTAPS